MQEENLVSFTVEPEESVRKKLNRTNGDFGTVFLM